MAQSTRIAAAWLLLACIALVLPAVSLASPTQDHLERFAQNARHLLQTADNSNNAAVIAAVASQQGLDLDTPIKAEDEIQTINENALKQQLVQKKYVQESIKQEQQAMMEENMAILMKQREAYESAVMEEAKKKAVREAELQVAATK